MSHERAREIERGRLTTIGQSSSSGHDHIDANDRLVEHDLVGQLVDEVDVVLVNPAALHP